MAHLEPLPLRPGWRGAVAYLASPWRWPTVPFALFTALVVGAGLWIVAVALVQAGRGSASGVEAAAGIVFAGVFLLAPAVRSGRRRLADRPR